MSSELEKDQACLTAVKTFNKTFKEIDIHNIKVRSDTAVALKDWEDRKSIYEGYVSRWRTKKDEYNVWNKYDGKSHVFWAADNGTCWWGENRTDANIWCKNTANDKRLDGENYRVGEWGWCSGRYGNFSCVKPEDIQKNQQQDYKNVEPVFVNSDKPTPNDFGGLREYPQNTNINCCSNIVNLRNTDFQNIKQSCESELNKKIQSAQSAPVTSPDLQPAPVTSPDLQPAPVTSPDLQPAPVTSPTALQNNSIQHNLSLVLQKKQLPEENYKYLIFISVLILLVIFSSSISSMFLFLS